MKWAGICNLLYDNLIGNKTNDIFTGKEKKSSFTKEKERYVTKRKKRLLSSWYLSIFHFILLDLY